MNLSSLSGKSESLMVSVTGAPLHGDLFVPENPIGIVMFVHGSGSSRFSSRNRFVPRHLNEGGLAKEILDMNRYAAQRLRCPWQLKVIPCATHLFEEPGKLEQVAALAREWFLLHLSKSIPGADR